MMTLASFNRRLLGTVLLALFLLSSLFVLWRRDQVRWEREQLLERRLAAMGREILSVVDSHRRLLRGMAFIDSRHRAAAAAVSSSLMPFLALVDARGVVMESYRGWLGEGALIPGKLLSTGLSVTPLLSPDGSPLVVLAQPAGVREWLVGGFSPFHLFSRRDLLGDEEWALLLSQEGQVLVSLGRTRLFPFGAAIPTELMASPSATKSWAGVKQRFFFLPLPEQSLTVAVGYPDGLLWREAIGKGLAAGGAVLLGALLVLGLVFPLFSSLLKSLSSLSASLVRSENLLARAADPVEAMEVLRELGRESPATMRFAELQAIEAAFGRLLETAAREGEELAGLYEESSAMEEEISDSNRRLRRVMDRLNVLLQLSQGTQVAGDLDGAVDTVARELCRLFDSPFSAVVAFQDGEPLLWSWSGRSDLKETFFGSLRGLCPGEFFSGPVSFSWEGLRLFRFPARTLQHLVGGVVIALPPEGDGESLEGVMEPFLSHLAGLLHSREMLAEIKAAYHDVALRMQSLTEIYHEETGAHLGRIGEYAALFGHELGLDRETVSDLRAFSQLHDLGKLKVPREILSKPSALTEEEFAVVRKHTLWGAEILAHSPRFAMARNICLYHHERWCGGGYPEGLAGEAIPLEGRIVAVCDVYDALRSKRSYKPSFSHERALEILLEGDGRVGPEHFDPRLLEILRRRGGELASIFGRFPERETG